MSENLNETFEEVMDDASVITVPIDTTLTRSGEAAEAAAVGAALALKADLSQVTGISVNGENPDAQGAILLDASEIPMTEEQDADSVADEIEALKAKTAEDIAMSSEDETTVAEKIAELEDGLEGMGWTYITTQTGTTPVMVPSTAREYLVIARYGTSGGAQAQAFQFNIPVGAPSGLSYCNGFYTASAQMLAQVAFVKSNNDYSIYLVTMNVSGTEYKSTSSISVWYR